MGKLLIIFGLIIVVVRVIVYFSDRFPSIGKLPGDIVVKRENFTFYFPLATSILLSVIVSLIFYLIKKLG